MNKSKGLKRVRISEGEMLINIIAGAMVFMVSACVALLSFGGLIAVESSDAAPDYLMYPLNSIGISFYQFSLVAFPLFSVFSFFGLYLMKHAYTQWIK